jgi:cytochrome c-type biogenesis protein CcmE
MPQRSQSLRIGFAVVVVLGVIAWLAVSGIQSNKSYYVTITELQNMGAKAYTRHLRVAGNVVPGSIERNGTHAQFELVELGKRLPVQYAGVEPPPDTFKDNAQALAIGTYGRDGVFRATELQAKCASKYAPAQQPGAAPSKPAPAAPDKTAALRKAAPASAN